MITTSAKTLAECVTEEELKNHTIYPSLKNIRNISARIAAAVMQKAKDEGIARLEEWPSNLYEFVTDCMYQPVYLPIQQSSL